MQLYSPARFLRIAYMSVMAFIFCGPILCTLPYNCQRKDHRQHTKSLARSLPAQLHKECESKKNMVEGYLSRHKKILLALISIPAVVAIASVGGYAVACFFHRHALPRLCDEKAVTQLQLSSEKVPAVQQMNILEQLADEERVVWEDSESAWRQHIAEQEQIDFVRCATADYVCSQVQHLDEIQRDAFAVSIGELVSDEQLSRKTLCVEQEVAYENWKKCELQDMWNALLAQHRCCIAPVVGPVSGAVQCASLPIVGIGTVS